jgi:hypothetical protein
MAFSLSRNAKLYVSTSQTIAGLTNANTWEIPILDGFSFTAATTTQEIEISEAGTTPTRGQQVFTTAIEPVDWSIQSYMRPRYDALDSVDDAVERILWEALAASPTGNTVGTGADGNATTRQAAASGGLAIDFSDSNTNELLELSLIFNLGTTAAPTWYHIVGAVIDTAEIDFGIEEIASISWTGFGTSVIEVTDSTDLTSLSNMLTDGAADNWQDSAFPDGTAGYLAAPTGAQACIRNKLSTVSLVADSGQVGIGGNTYTLALTGGSLTISNNITFLTPEALGVVNNPCGHFTGQRTVSGNMTAYLKTGGTNDTGDLLNDLLTYSNDPAGSDPTQFALDINVGGPAAVSPYDTPIVSFTMVTAHLVIPTINIEDVVSVDIPFTGLPTTAGAPDPDAFNELTVAYYADET